jgi:UDP-N-acetylglucosamine 2-epimerase (non-hydrolysing)
LRTRTLASRCPEEFNRRAAAISTSFHCASTPRALDNLLAETVHPADIAVTGNTAIDALLWCISHEGISVNGRQREDLVVVTAHRRDNFGQPLQNICSAIKRLASAFRFVFVTHPDPNAGAIAGATLDSVPHVNVIEHLDLPNLPGATNHQRLGGHTRGDAHAARSGPDNSQRDRATRSSRVRRSPFGPDNIVREAATVLSSQALYLPEVRNPFGDGKASKSVLEHIIRRYG